MAVGFISPYTYYVSRTWYFGWGTLPNGPVVFAFTLVALNGLVLRLRPSLGLTRSDVLVIYVILTMAAALITVIIPYTIGLTAYPFYHRASSTGGSSPSCRTSHGGCNRARWTASPDSGRGSRVEPPSPGWTG